MGKARGPVVTVRAHGEEWTMKVPRFRSYAEASLYADKVVEWLRDIPKDWPDAERDRFHLEAVATFMQHLGEPLIVIEFDGVGVDRG